MTVCMKFVLFKQMQKYNNEDTQNEHERVTKQFEHSYLKHKRTVFCFFCCISSRLSARISDFENILLMVHVGGVHACAAGARYATFFFTNARF